MPKDSDDIYFLVLLGMAGMLILSLALVLFYLRYQKRLFSQRELLHEAGIRHQVELLNSTIQSQEAERKRIGRDLHDEVGGALANLRVSISRLSRGPAPENFKDDVERCQKQADSIMNTVRHISHSLSPSGLELFGFTEVLQELCDQRAQSSGMTVTCIDEASAWTGKLPNDTAIALYRVVQELLTNTMKHASARQVEIRITEDAGHLILEYTDDGIGIPDGRNPRGMGMRNIEGRLNLIGAKHRIQTGGPGFHMFVSVPVDIHQTSSQSNG